MRHYTNLIIFIEPSIKQVQMRRHMQGVKSDRASRGQVGREENEEGKAEIEGDRDSEQNWPTSV